MKLPITIIAAGIGSLLIAAPVLADQSVQGATVTVTKTDFKGRPPFKRRTETLSIEDVASLEAQPTERSGQYQTVTTVDFRGHPPFKRRTQSLPVEDIASFEAGPLDQDNSSPAKFRGKPPYRR